MPDPGERPSGESARAFADPANGSSSPVDRTSKYLARYVDEFVYRFNRRSLPNLFDYFCRWAMQTTWTEASGLAPELMT
jgi:hypothetical protein